MEPVIRECLRYIESHTMERLSVEEIASQFGYSKHHFSRMFSQALGVSIKSYITKTKLVKSAQAIIGGSTILEAAVLVGYETHTGYNKAFKKYFGYSPKLLLAASFTRDLYDFQGGQGMKAENLYNEIKELTKGDISKNQLELLRLAYEFALKAHGGQKRYSGDDYVTHPLQVSILLIKMNASPETVVLGLLHDCNEADSNISVEATKPIFGEIIYNKLVRINQLNVSPDLLETVDIETEEDIVLVKLADRLHNMSTLKHLKPERWHEKATETLAVFSPIAEALGYVDLKANLDQLSVKVLDN